MESKGAWARIIFAAAVVIAAGLLVLGMFDLSSDGEDIPIAGPVPLPGEQDSAGAVEEGGRSDDLPTVGDGAGPVGSPAGGPTTEGAEGEEDPPDFDDPYALQDHLRSMLDRGRIAYNPPDTMRLNQRREMSLRISVDTADQAIRELFPEPAEVVDTIAGISPVMSARLWTLGSGIKVEPLTDSTQPLGRQRPAHWRWSLTAVDGGSSLLVLNLRAAISNGPGSEITFPTTYQDKIYVTVTGGEKLGAFFGEYWFELMLALVTGILVPVALYRANQRRRGRAETKR